MHSLVTGTDDKDFLGQSTVVQYTLCLPTITRICRDDLRCYFMVVLEQYAL